MQRKRSFIVALTFWLFMIAAGSQAQSIQPASLGNKIDFLKEKLDTRITQKGFFELISDQTNGIQKPSAASFSFEFRKEGFDARALPFFVRKNGSLKKRRMFR